MKSRSPCFEELLKRAQLPSDETVLGHRQLPFRMDTALMGKSTDHHNAPIMPSPVQKYSTVLHGIRSSMGLLARLKHLRSLMIQTLEGALCVSGKGAHMLCFVPRIKQRMKLDTMTLSPQPTVCYVQVKMMNGPDLGRFPKTTPFLERSVIAIMALIYTLQEVRALPRLGLTDR